MGGGGSKFGWIIAATVRRFGSRSHSTSFFYTEPPTSDGSQVLFPGFQDQALFGNPAVRTKLFSGWHGLAEKP